MTDKLESLKNEIEQWEEEKNLLFRKNITCLDKEDLDKLGFLSNDSFLEEKNRYDKESVIKKKYSEKYKKNDYTTKEYDDFKQSYIETEDVKIMDHYSGGIQKSRKILQYVQFIENEKEKMKKYKQMKGLKYNHLKNKINLIQLSVIFFSTCITFIESIKKIYEIENKTLELLPIILSTYIGFILAISRFFKYDDLKETLMKLDEKQSIVISRLGHRYTILQKFLPITRFTDQGKISEIIDVDFNKDGLDDMISQTYQDYDLNMSFTEKIYYKKKWLKLKEIDINQQTQSKKLKSGFPVELDVENNSENNPENNPELIV